MKQIIDYFSSKINFKVRFNNRVFVIQLIVAIFTPILYYNNITFEDITTWSGLIELLNNTILNPALLAMVIISVLNLSVDPTTKGLSDSKRALEYKKPQ